MHDSTSLEQSLKITFINKDILRQALVHRSFLNENRNFPLGHNERLEFLGDAVLELVVTEYLYLHFDNPEGELTNWRAAMVNAKTLSDIAETFHIYEYLHLSRGEAKDANAKARSYILANAFEAIIGAIYLDQGWDVAKQFIADHVLSRLDDILKHKLYIDPKSRFQEASQDRMGITPHYTVLEESGPDHAKKFVIGVYLGGEMIAQGEGTSKQEAQVAAAENALAAKGW
ncbi:MAG: ribonuclease III [Patescibacteria group bacterium]